MCYNYLMKTPIINKLKDYKDRGALSFHTPGHKNRINEEFASLMAHIDATELRDTDSIFNPKGIIKDSQEEIARAYGAAYSFLNVSGSTTGNYIALAGLTKPKDKVLIQRNSHKSVHNALILNDLDPVYLRTNFDRDFGFATSIKEGALEEAFMENPDIKLVLITSPNYYGLVQDIEAIADLVHSHGAKLIVDEAHGAHLAFLRSGPKSALHLGADLVINSTHKNLPSLTQTSLIHLANKAYLDDIRQAYNIYITTSPSFILMASIEDGVAYMEKEGGQALDLLGGQVQKLKEDLDQVGGINVYRPQVDLADPMRLVVNIDGLSGTKLSRTLAEDYNIDVEMNDHKNIVALFSPMTSSEDLESLKDALVSIANGPRPNLPSWSYTYDDLPQVAYLPREAFYKDKEVISYKESLGRVVADAIIPYPPGVPLLVPGEIMDEDKLDLISHLIDEEIHIINIEDERIKVLK